MQKKNSICKKFDMSVYRLKGHVCVDAYDPILWEVLIVSVIENRISMGAIQSVLSTIDGDAGNMLV